jgi:hypothetical protein
MIRNGEELEKPHPVHPQLSADQNCSSYEISKWHNLKPWNGTLR